MTRYLSVSSRVSTLALAVALVVGPSPATAQSFQGTGTFTNPADGSISTPDASTTNISITAPQAVIDWAPFDANPGPGAIGFQYDGTTATFSGASDFAVLNRIVPVDPSRAIVMDGIINSLVGGSTGGSVYFYSPGGIVIGSNAVIDVGSLVLTTSPITVTDDGNGNFSFIDANGTVEFGQAPNPAAQINLVAGSEISALNEGSYVAVVAPRVTHEGAISVNGAAALVGAEAATLTFRTSGLFDIQVDVGTTDANGVGVNGTITGPFSSGPGDYHRAYLVAVPKNTALTIAIGGGAELGFDIAEAADVVGNAVVLSSGHDVFFGDTSSAPSTASGADADISIAFVDFTSALYARANGDLFAGAAGGGALNFASDVSLRGRDNVLMEAGTDGSVSIGGNLTMSANRTGSTEGASVTAGNVVLQAWGGGTLSVTGNTVLTAIGIGGSSETPGLPTGDGTGGNILVQATTGGDLSLGGSLNADATGSGGSFVGDIDGGDGFGGTVNLFASGGGSLSVAGGTYLTADGEAGFPIECIGCGGIGGIGDAGTINVQAHSGPGTTIDFGDVLYMWANGQGGFGQSGGFGLGGNVNLSASDGSVVTAAGDVSMEAEGRGGDAFGVGNTGGTGQGGFVQAFANNDGTLDLAAGLSGSADGTGGDSEAGNGGLGRGGTAGIQAFGTAGSLVELTGPVFVTADGQGGGGLDGGTGTGGIAYFSAVRGTVHAFGNVTVTANSDGGAANSAGGTGGSGLADIETIVTPEMTEAALFSSAGTLIVDGLAVVAANATGGDGGFNGGDGGDAVAAGIAGVVDGGAVIHAANSDNGPSIIRLGNVVVTADAQGGQGTDGQGGTNGSDGGNGGSATAGKAVITAAAGSGDLTAGATTLSASATAGDGGNGGSGDGGNGGNGGDGGTATGGFINVGTESGNVNFAQAANNGTATYTSIVALTDATGGDGGDAGFGNIAGVAGNGGDAFGGSSFLLVRGSEVTVGGVNLDASATGGDGGLDTSEAPQGAGGDATAGTIGVLVTNRFNLPNQRGTLTAGNIVGTATADGGAGGTDGLSLSVGGNQFVVRRSDATIASVSLVTTADAFDGSSDFASSSPIEIQNGTVAISGQFVFRTPGEVSMWTDNGSLSAAQITVDADNFIHDEFLPAPATLGTFSANNIFLTTDQDLVVDGHMISLNGVGFNAPGLIDFDNVTSTNGPLALTAGQTIDAGNLSAGQLVAVNGGGDVAVGNINATVQQAIVSSTGGDIVTGTIGAGTFISLGADVGDITTGNLTAGTFVFAQGDGSILTGDIGAGTTIDLFSNASGITSGDLIAGTDIMLDAVGDIQFGDAQASIIDFDSGGSVTGGDIVAGTSATGSASGPVVLGDINVGIFLAGGLADDGFAVGLSSETGINVGDVDADEAIGFATLGDLITGDLSAGTDVMALVSGDMDIASITTPGNGRTYIADAQMFLDAGGPDNFDPSLVFNAMPLQSAGALTITGPVSTGTFQAAATSITTGNIAAFDLVTMDSAGLISTGDITAASIDLLAGTDIGTGDLTTQPLLFLLFPGASVTLEAGGGISTGDISSFDGVYANAGGGISTGSIDAGDFVWLLAGSDIVTGPINAFGYIELESTGGGIDTEELDSDEHIDLLAASDIFILSAVAAEYVDIESISGDIGSGGITAGDAIEVRTSDGNVDVGDLSAGIVSPVPEGEHHIAVVATNGSVNASSATALGDVYLAASNNLITGNIDAGGRILGLAGGDMTVGAMTTDALGQILLGDYSMLALGGDVGSESYDVEAVFNAEPIPTGGSITINGPVSTGWLQAAAGGLLTFNGDVTADSSSLMSGDIQLGSGVTVSGFTGLYSINADGTFIGDGLAGPGYMLSNAEYNAFQNVSMEVRPDLGAAALLVLGDLDIASDITSADFGIEDADDNDLGTIRVVGDVRMNNAAGELFFESETFQLDAATGSIVISADGTTPGGELIIAANNVHVAEGSILDQLAADPQYAGYQDDLNAPASVPRSDGVIRAGTVSIEFGDTPAELYTLYVQNMGTEATPAGFVITDINLGDDGESTLPAGSVDLVINGQIVTGNGTLTGIDVRDLLVEGRDLTAFTDNSTINNCALVGDCGDVVEPPPPPETPLDRPDFQPSPGIQQEIVLAEDNVLPPPDFGNEDFIDDNDEETEDSATSPIAPPDPLFDTSELGEEADAAGPEVGTSMRSSPGGLTQPGDVDDPVSGSGNPALMETPAGPPSNEEKQQ